MELSAKPYHLLDRDEQVAVLEDLSRELYGCHLELSQVRIQYLWAYGQAYRASQSQHVSGRIQEAEIASAGVKEDEIALLGRIDALTTMRDYLMQIFLAREPDRVMVRRG